MADYMSENAMIPPNKPGPPSPAMDRSPGLKVTEPPGVQPEPVTPPGLLVRFTMQRV